MIGFNRFGWVATKSGGYTPPPNYPLLDPTYYTITDKDGVDIQTLDTVYDPVYALVSDGSQRVDINLNGGEGDEYFSYKIVLAYDVLYPSTQGVLSLDPTDRGYITAVSQDGTGHHPDCGWGNTYATNPWNIGLDLDRHLWTKDHEVYSFDDNSFILGGDDDYVGLYGLSLFARRRSFGYDNYIEAKIVSFKATTSYDNGSSYVDIGHYKAVPIGSMLYGATTNAPTNCFYNITDDKYYQPNTGLGVAHIGYEPRVW